MYPRAILPIASALRRPFMLNRKLAASFLNDDGSGQTFEIKSLLLTTSLWVEN